MCSYACMSAVRRVDEAFTCAYASFVSSCFISYMCSLTYNHDCIRALSLSLLYMYIPLSLFLSLSVYIYIYIHCVVLHICPYMHTYIHGIVDVVDVSPLHPSMLSELSDYTHTRRSSLRSPLSSLLSPLLIWACGPPFSKHMLSLDILMRQALGRGGWSLNCMCMHNI